jgi:hypothetical protein
MATDHSNRSDGWLEVLANCAHPASPSRHTPALDPRPAQSSGESNDDCRRGRSATSSPRGEPANVRCGFLHVRLEWSRAAPSSFAERADVRRNRYRLPDVTTSVSTRPIALTSSPLRSTGRVSSCLRLPRRHELALSLRAQIDAGPPPTRGSPLSRALLLGLRPHLRPPVRAGSTASRARASTRTLHKSGGRATFRR